MGDNSCDSYHSLEEDSGMLGVNKEFNRVPLLPDLMPKGIYLSYARYGIIYA